MVKSSHNIFSQVRESDRWFIINPLSRQADLLDADSAEEYRSGRFSDPSVWAEKGYIVDPSEEQKRFRDEYLDFVDRRDSDEVQLFFVPWYACNFNCSYCYQEEYEFTEAKDTVAVIDAFFSYIDHAFAQRNKYITIFGGEPLLTGDSSRRAIEDILSAATRRSLDTAIVTNGFTLSEFVPLLRSYRIREIQVTLDGMSEMHDRRRPHRGGLPSFDRIVKGIDDALAAGLPVNLRMVVDRENIDELPKLARFAIDRGWTGNPLFKTQLGRNYELHTCQKGANRLYSRVELYDDVYRLVRRNPFILDFHRPAFSLSRFLWENGELPEPLFDSCPGTKTEWAFDYTGRIYSCTATVGKKGEELGTFHPLVALNRDSIDEWEERDVTTIAGCGECSLRLACGGGCAAVAKNKTGHVQSPDCRPVKELLELGMSLYFADEMSPTR